MQTLYKSSIIAGVLLLLGCEDNLQLNPEESLAEVRNSLTISVQDPDASAISGSFELSVSGPKTFVSTETKASVRLFNLPDGEYTISITKTGHVPFRKLIRIVSSPDKQVEQRYRVEVPLARRGATFRFQNNAGGSVFFPAATPAANNASFPVSGGLSRYNSVRVTLPPCSLAGENCNGDIQLSASIVPLHADFFSEAISASKMGLFFLDLEAEKVYSFSKSITVEFPLALNSETLRSLPYVMERVVKESNTGLLTYTGETIPVTISADGTKGLAQLPDAKSDWVFAVRVKLETSALPVAFASLIKSKKPGVEVAANVSLKKAYDPLLSELLGLKQEQTAIEEAINVLPARDKIAEISYNVLHRKFTIRNPFSNEPILIATDFPIYPLAFKTVVGVPHDSGGGG
ncbi:MAG: hypothetical protein KGQ86_11325 [Bacteroidetes bacterium]|nr:hypothetical protein [Bacteroidota bacterium]